MKWKKYGKAWPNLWHYPGIWLGLLSKIKKTSVRIIGVQVEIHTVVIKEGKWHGDCMCTTFMKILLYWRSKGHETKDDEENAGLTWVLCVLIFYRTISKYNRGKRIMALVTQSFLAFIVLTIWREGLKKFLSCIFSYIQIDPAEIMCVLGTCICMSFGIFHHRNYYEVEILCRECFRLSVEMLFAPYRSNMICHFNEVENYFYLPQKTAHSSKRYYLTKYFNVIPTVFW
jgi:hypothetical protein